MKRSDTSCSTPVSSEPRNMPRKLLASTRPRLRVRCSRLLVSDTWLKRKVEDGVSNSSCKHSRILD